MYQKKDNSVFMAITCNKHYTEPFVALMKKEIIIRRAYKRVLLKIFFSEKILLVRIKMTRKLPEA